MSFPLAPQILTGLDLLVLVLHLLTHDLGEPFHDGAHDAEVGHVVHVALVRLRGDGLQLVLVCVLHTCMVGPGDKEGTC